MPTQQIKQFKVCNDLESHLYDIKSIDLYNIRYRDYITLFLSNLEIFDFVSMRWLPRTSLILESIHNHNHHICYNKVFKPEYYNNILRIPRINHSVTVVGNHLCIFGGISTSDVLIIENFVKNTEKINTKYYNNKTKKKKQQQQEQSGYDETNALSLSKHLFGISPNVFSNGSYRMVQCANCLILECNRFNFRTCSGCAQVQYCSKLCQKNHWKLNHRHFCTKNHIRYQ